MVHTIAAPFAFMVLGQGPSYRKTLDIKGLQGVAHFSKTEEIGCERSYAASAANSLAQLAFFNGLLAEAAERLQASSFRPSGSHLRAWITGRASSTLLYDLSEESTDTNAFCGIFTWPICFIFALPFFCFSSNLFFRVTSPP